MTSERPIDERVLHAYVDNALAPEERAAIEAQLGANPDLARRAEEYRRQNELLRAALEPMLDEAIPPHVGLRTTRTGPVRWRRYSSLAASLVVAGALGWFLRGEVDVPQHVDFGETLAQHAAIAHRIYAPEVLHPVEVSANQEDHLVGWLSKRLGVPVHAPHLSGAGFQLVGGRLLPGENRPAAQFMYQDPQGQRLTLYVAANAGASRETAFRYSEADNVNTFYWIDGQLGYALSGELTREELLPVAETVYRQLSR